MKKFKQYIIYVEIIFFIMLIIIIGLLIKRKEEKQVFIIDKNLGRNIYTNRKITNFYDIYNEEVQNNFEEQIFKLINDERTFENPLIIYNAYGTNKLSANIYFYNEEDLKFKYEISTEDNFMNKDICVNQQNGLYEMQIVGLESGKKNKVSILASNNNKFEFNINVPKYDMPDVKVTKYEDETDAKISDGLYAYLGMLREKEESDNPYFDNWVDDLYLVDNNGVVRGIVPLNRDIYSMEDNTADNIIFYQNCMYYNISSHQVAKVNNLGKVEKIYSFDGYNKDHDFTIDKDKNKLLVIANKNDSTSVGDYILIYDLNKSNIDSLIDMKKILNEIYVKCSPGYDWIHLNTVQIKDDGILLSSRELNSIIFLSDIYNEPKIEYILGDKEMYEGTSYYDYVYSPKNDFYMHLGQHTTYLIGDDELYLYNNDCMSPSEASWFNWEKYENERTSLFSYFYLYKIDHNNKTYELIEQIKVPFSAVMSSAQILENGNKVIYSREAKVCREYDKNNNLLIEYLISRYSYRIYKYDFKNFWFE